MFDITLDAQILLTTDQNFSYVSGARVPDLVQPLRAGVGERQLIFQTEADNNSIGSIVR